ncbi:MAG: protein kinase, partial [Planctomycetia bacterium]|nr:protein kinase [Planctomycetia bacterium]
MLMGIVKEFEAAQSRIGVDPYAAWSVAVQQLRSDWQEGTRANIEQLRDYLADVADDQKYEALQDLIAEHLQLAWQAGQGTDLTPYLAAFSREFAELASPETLPADLIEDEFLARHVPPHGDTPLIDEYQRRFPSRRDLMQLIERRHLENGRYVKLRELGRGAMGEVFEAYDHHLRRFVAIKLPKSGVAEVAELLHRFAEEARITAGLEHSAIVTVHENYDGPAMPFYVMRLAAGVPLTQHIRDFHYPPMDRPRSEQRVLENRILQAFATICEAIAYAHAHGVLHRDLKP